LKFFGIYTSASWGSRRSSSVPSPSRLGGIQEPRHAHLKRPGWFTLPALPLGQRSLVHAQLPREYLLPQPEQCSAANQSVPYAARWWRQRVVTQETDDGRHVLQGRLRAVRFSIRYGRPVHAELLRHLPLAQFQGQPPQPYWWSPTVAHIVRLETEFPHRTELLASLTHVDDRIPLLDYLQAQDWQTGPATQPWSMDGIVSATLRSQTKLSGGSQ